MAKGSRGGRRGNPAPVGKGASVAQSNTPARNIGTTTAGQTRNYQDMDDTQAQALHTANADTYDDPDFAVARKMYIANNDPNGDGFSYSQNLNYKLDNNLPLDANETWINDNLQKGMHALGNDTNLVRYCHDDILQKCGIKDYTKLTDAQLQSKLVGMELTTTAYMSTSYDGKKNPFNPKAIQGGGREVLMNVKAGGTTQVVFGAKAQAEIIMNKGTNIRITGIHYDGTYATPRNKGTKPRVVLDVETF